MSVVAPIAAALSKRLPIFIPSAACPFTGITANEPKCTKPRSKFPQTVFVSIGLSESTKKSGKPYINIVGKTKKILNKKFKRKKSIISLSLSDEKKYAVAFVTISL